MKKKHTTISNKKKSLLKKVFNTWFWLDQLNDVFLIATFFLMCGGVIPFALGVVLLIIGIVFMVIIGKKREKGTKVLDTIENLLG